MTYEAPELTIVGQANSLILGGTLHRNDSDGSPTETDSPEE
jgi:hypothetical protein